MSGIMGDMTQPQENDLPPGVTMHPDGGTIEHADGVHPRHGGTPNPIPIPTDFADLASPIKLTEADPALGGPLTNVADYVVSVDFRMPDGTALSEYFAEVNATTPPTVGSDLVTPTGILVSAADPGTPEWLAARREGITATDLPMILDLNDSGDPEQHGNQYGNALSVWADKTGRLPDSAAGEAAEWGHIHEPAIAARWERLHNVRVWQVGIIAHQNYPWQRCSLDRIVEECPDGDGPCSLEIKTRSAFKAGVFRDDVPDDVLAQVTWQLAVSGYAHSHVAVLLGGNRMVEFRVDRDPAVERLLLASAQTVWEHVLSDTPPPADPSPVLLRILDAMHPSRAGQTEVAPEVWAELAAEQAAAAADMKAAKARQATAKAAIVAALADGDTLTVGGRPVVTYGVVNRRGYTVEPTTYRMLKISGGGE